MRKSQAVTTGFDVEEEAETQAVPVTSTRKKARKCLSPRASRRIQPC
jgi:hypothetical protein